MLIIASQSVQSVPTTQFHSHARVAIVSAQSVTALVLDNVRNVRLATICSLMAVLVLQPVLLATSRILALYNARPAIPTA